MSDPTARKPRPGFHTMDPPLRREIASRGGRTAHAMGRAHKWTLEEAREAGRKGGAAKQAKREAERVISTTDDDGRGT